MDITTTTSCSPLRSGASATATASKIGALRAFRDDGGKRATAAARATVRRRGDSRAGHDAFNFGHTGKEASLDRGSRIGDHQLRRLASVTRSTALSSVTSATATGLLLRAARVSATATQTSASAVSGKSIGAGHRLDRLQGRGRPKPESELLQQRSAAEGGFRRRSTSRQGCGLRLQRSRVRLQLERGYRLSRSECNCHAAGSAAGSRSVAGGRKLGSRFGQFGRRQASVSDRRRLPLQRRGLASGVSGYHFGLEFKRAGRRGRGGCLGQCAPSMPSAMAMATGHPARSVAGSGAPLAGARTVTAPETHGSILPAPPSASISSICRFRPRAIRAVIGHRDGVTGGCLLDAVFRLAVKADVHQFGHLGVAVRGRGAAKDSGDDVLLAALGGSGQVEAGGRGVAGLDPVRAFIVASRNRLFVFATVAIPASAVRREKML